MEITLIFENCEELTFTTNENTLFYMEGFSKEEYLCSLVNSMVTTRVFKKGYLVIPENVVIDEQEGLSNFINDGSCDLTRITAYADITQISYGEGRHVFTPWDLDHSDQLNRLQKTYITPKGSIVIDWEDCLLGKMGYSTDKPLVGEFLDSVDSNVVIG